MHRIAPHPACECLPGYPPGEHVVLSEWPCPVHADATPVEP